MSLEDYNVNTQTAEVVLGTELIARFDSSTGEVLEYLNSGKNRKRWIKEAIARAPALQEGIEEEDISWDLCEEITNPTTAHDGVIPKGFFLVSRNSKNKEIVVKRDFYSVFKNAPQPKDNKLGYKNKVVYDWVQKEYPQLVEVLYPSGPWDPFAAGCSGNRTHPVRGKPREIETIRG